ncbi:hypothetical protein C4D60_Mb02t13320 [Musa balbisiana]|uniref:Phosphoglycerate mutase-like protein 1 n=1 Tax=Musa balbisiana TaxID=52838 RepID=A0A4S8IAE7_MUSBA|nr:hypothetical protein C4D60_Mb02t13320 [Musa balbisiana]
MTHSVFASPSSSSSVSVATTNHRCYHRCKTHLPIPSLTPFLRRPPPPSPSLSWPRRLAASAPVRCTSGLSEMDDVTGSSLFPLQRCKTVHLVRHAQGIHNVEGEKDYKAYLSPELFDAHLTPLGWDQIELVITSPLLRTMQTAVGVFGGDSHSDGNNTPALMVENAGKSTRPAISSLNCPPFIAVEYCREHLIENDEDILWKADVREANEEVAARGVKFINWLWTRKEKEIAIVSHSGFLFHTLQMFGGECHPIVKEEIGKHFANCELRSMVLVDRSMLGSDSSCSNYPGKAPGGLDLPSDVAHEKHCAQKNMV